MRRASAPRNHRSRFAPKTHLPRHSCLGSALPVFPKRRVYSVSCGTSQTDYPAYFDRYQTWAITIFAASTTARWVFDIGVSPVATGAGEEPRVETRSVQTDT